MLYCQSHSHAIASFKVHAFYDYWKLNKNLKENSNYSLYIYSHCTCINYENQTEFDLASMHEKFTKKFKIAIS